MTTSTMLTTNDLARGFKVSTMSLYLWRQGTPTKTALPYEVDENKRVSFDLKKVKAWADEHGLKFNEKAAVKGEARRAGPKPRERKRTKH